MTLFSYCIPFDDGAAPNPFWGTCTLAICKPVIRRLAKKGDWIVGTGSRKYGFQNRMVYAMEVTDTCSFGEYDTLCNSDSRLIKKIPFTESKDLRRRVGDCIYYFSGRDAIQRDGPHDDGNIAIDLRGNKVLLSNNFYYFGGAPIKMPRELYPIVKQGQGHKSKSNNEYVAPFLNWIGGLKRNKNKIIGMPFGFNEEQLNQCITGCSRRHRINDQKDELLGRCE